MVTALAGGLRGGLGESAVRPRGSLYCQSNNRVEGVLVSDESTAHGSIVRPSLHSNRYNLQVPTSRFVIVDEILFLFQNSR